MVPTTTATTSISITLARDMIVLQGVRQEASRQRPRVNYGSRRVSCSSCLFRHASQHARAVDLRVQDREASTEFKRLAADHAKHVCDKKESHMYGEIKAAIGRG